MTKRFRIALTYAGEQRPYVEEVAQILALKFSEAEILYDKFHEAELARPKLAFYLPDLYSKDSDLIVVICCKEYNEREWCGLEWTAIYSLVKQKEDHRVMLIGEPGMELEGLHDLHGSLSLEDTPPAMAAKLILERLALNEGKPRQFHLGQPPTPSVATAPKGSTLLVRSFPPAAPDPPDLGLPPLDLTDLFHNREPIHDQVWAQALPERLQAALPELARQPMPLALALNTHLSIAWYLGTQLTPKRGFSVRPLQRGVKGLEPWDGSNPEPPPEDARWQISALDLNRGPDLALVLSVTRLALEDVEQAIRTLALPIHRLLHFSLPQPNQQAIANGSQASWYVEAMVREATRHVQQDRPPRIHLFAACPVAMAFLLGQQAEALGPTTVYEFGMGHADRRYTPGMAS